MNPEKILQKIINPILIYGAHLVAVNLLWYLQELGKDVMGFAVTSMDGNPNELEGISVKPIEEYAKYAEDAVVIIATPQRVIPEISRKLESLHFLNVHAIDLEGLSSIQAARLANSYNSNAKRRYQLSVNRLDETWLDLFPDKEQTEGNHLKFPALFHEKGESLLNHLDSVGTDLAFRQVFRHTSMLPNVKSSNFLSDISVYMAYTERDADYVVGKQLPSWIKPLQVGGEDAFQNIEGYTDDFSGGISDKNRLFGEMTGVYWIWKKAPESRYKGLCHYRRLFNADEYQLASMQENGVDVLLTTPRYVPGGVKNLFLRETPVKEHVYDTLLLAISNCYGEVESQAFDQQMEGTIYFPNNMVVAKSELYDAYCAWIFPVLNRMMDLDGESGYGHGNDRHIAYAAEMVTSYYFMNELQKSNSVYVDYQLVH